MSALPGSACGPWFAGSGHGHRPVHINDVIGRLTPPEMRNMLACFAGAAPEAFEFYLLKTWAGREHPLTSRATDRKRTGAESVAKPG